MIVNKYSKKYPEEWLEKRKEYITGTDIATLFGLNKNMGLKKLIQSKENTQPIFNNEYMRAGRLLEPSVFIALQELNIDAEPADLYNTILISDDENHIAASIDGKVLIDGKNRIVECKTTSGLEYEVLTDGGLFCKYPNKFQLWKLGKIPLNYLLQVHLQLLISNTDYIILACMQSTFPFPLVIIKVNFDKVINEMIIQTVKRFFDNKDEFKVDKKDKETISNLLLHSFNKIFIDGIGFLS